MVISSENIVCSKMLYNNFYYFTKIFVCQIQVVYFKKAFTVALFLNDYNFIKNKSMTKLFFQIFPLLFLRLVQGESFY